MVDGRVSNPTEAPTTSPARIQSNYGVVKSDI